ncbi:Holliday junction resolvase RuvX [Leifsonia bigeumensis]|uniref:Putative pre-16S rRNA nuclease n=1 Tax=Leifsonella bigeumensis TaxID=433643 RepID=A0ABP7FQJ0_9MICO
MTLRAGVRIGVDVGRARVGVARSDVEGLLVIPVVTVKRGAGDLAELARLAREHDALEFVVGLPLSLTGAQTSSTEDARGFAGRLAAASGLAVRLVDERLSTVAAQRSLQSTGKDIRSSRPVIDQVAATIILQNALETERSSGKPPGELIIQDEG